MENNKQKFRRTGATQRNDGETLEVQINRAGDAARYRMTIKINRNSIVTNGRWQKIKYSKRKDYAYITMYNEKIYLFKYFKNVIVRLPKLPRELKQMKAAKEEQYVVTIRGQAKFSGTLQECKSFCDVHDWDKPISERVCRIEKKV